MKSYFILRLPVLFALNLLAFPALLAGQNYALFFAVEKYQDSQIKRPPNAIQDAVNLGVLLGGCFGYQVEVVENPTAEEIGRKLRQYQERFAKEQFRKKGQLMIYFIGRGGVEGGEAYFLPADASSRDLSNTALPWRQCLADISQLGCRHILAVTDVDNSPSINPAGDSSMQLVFRNFLEGRRDQAYLENHEVYLSRILLALGSNKGRDSNRPGLTAVFRQELAGLARIHSSITMGRLVNTLVNEAAAPAKAFGFGDDDERSNFIFSKQSAREVELPEEDESLWKLVKKQNSLEGYSFYCQLYPFGRYAEEAIEKMQSFPDTWVSADGRPWKVEPTPPANEMDDLILVKGGMLKTSDPDKMGWPKSKADREFVIRDFYLSPYEVTAAEYDEFLYNSGKRVAGGRTRGHPAVNVDWYDALEFCNWLSRQRGLQEVYVIDKGKQDPNNFNLSDTKKWLVRVKWQANGYRLPTTTEWEYAACNGGVWKGYFANNSGTEPVGDFGKNHLGLYDLGGNVHEWCWDWEFPEYYENESKVYNPRGPQSGGFRSYRSAAWDTPSEALFCAFPFAGTPSLKRGDLGFRLARNVQ